jgi:prophage antirepressor-like protein
VNDLQIFNHEKFGQVRSLIKNGEPWFIAKDIADTLEFSSTWAMTKGLDEDEKGTTICSTLGGEQELTIINESGLYSAILRSRKPGAKKFKKWVTSEVLPSIRKHGAYMTDEVIERVLTDPDTIIKLATQLKETKKELRKKDRFIGQLASSKNSILVRQVAKIAAKKGIKIGEKRLWKKLREWGLIFKNSTEPMQEYVDRGYFEVSEGVKESSKGTFTYRTTRVTGKGQVYIIERLLREQTDDKVAVASE